MDRRYTHALCVIDYKDGAGVLQEEDQYAMAIQPLQMADSNKKRRRSRPSLKTVFQINPYWIDLCPSTPSKRSGQPDLLLQAVAPHRVPGGATIYDLTAGWAADSLLLATSGASRVQMVERDPIVACLLQDALRRLECISQSDGANGAWQKRATQLNDRLSLKVGDAREALKELRSTNFGQQPDILYLDPMFPPRTKTAAVKKGMQILHGLFNQVNVSDAAGTVESVREAEEAELLHLAYIVARVKVVVKRPLHAPTLGNDASGLKPSNIVKGSINRWDIYVKR